MSRQKKMLILKIFTVRWCSLKNTDVAPQCCLWVQLQRLPWPCVSECCAGFHIAVQKGGYANAAAPPTFVSGLSLLFMNVSHGDAKWRALSRGTEKAVLLFLTCACSVENEYFQQVIVQWLFQKSLNRYLMALGQLIFRLLRKKKKNQY